MGARTPEELETLLEDALLMRDGHALGMLFAPGAIFLVDDRLPARDRAIPEAVLALWDGDRAYVADPRRIFAVWDVALIETERGVNVARRNGDGRWRYAIVRQCVAGTSEEDRREPGS